MKNVTLLAKVDNEACRGCKVCQKVCPVLAISVVDGKAVVDDAACRGCTNCESRCPFYAIKMVRREEPFKIGVDVAEFDAEKIAEICDKAHINPQQILCYCVGVRAEEVAAAILGGATTPEEISLKTGIRTGCTIECVEPLLRMVDAAGIELKPIEGGWQWYGKTVTAWDLPEAVKEKYNSRGFYFNEDKALLDRVAKVEVKGDK
jgi:Pyruvate/2-oxoacid:ferredoxin oxidoreductase delta subunit/bacterioferritin-associated ferredoxin